MTVLQLPSLDTGRILRTIGKFQADAPSKHSYDFAPNQLVLAIEKSFSVSPLTSVY